MRSDEAVTLRARVVVPIEGAAIEDGAVRIEDGKIAAVGRWSELGGAGRVEDLGDVGLLPGFVNAHTHLELTCYAGRVDPGPFWDWIERLIALRRETGSAERERASIVEGARMSLEAGVTCVGDISRSGWSAASLRGTPIRRVCFVELISGASTPPGDPDELIEAVRAADAAADELTTIGVSPHAFFSVSWNDLRRTVAIAAESDRPITMHVAETAEEIDWLSGGGGRVSEFLERYGLPNASAVIRGGYMELLHRALMTRLRPLLAHANYTSDDELRMLAETRCSVAYCPRAHVFFGYGRHRWREMAAAGINVCVGTDSLASNSSLSVLDELRLLARSDGGIRAEALLEMGTLCGARALGIEETCGSLRAGKSADMTAIELGRLAGENMLESLLEGAGPVRAVWVRGRSIVRNGVYEAQNLRE